MATKSPQHVKSEWERQREKIGERECIVCKWNFKPRFAKNEICPECMTDDKLKQKHKT
jgi:hypothetical protein